MEKNEHLKSNVAVFEMVKAACTVSFHKSFVKGNLKAMKNCIVVTSVICTTKRDFQKIPGFTMLTAVMMHSVFCLCDTLKGVVLGGGVSLYTVYILDQPHFIKE